MVPHIKGRIHEPKWVIIGNLIMYTIRCVSPPHTLNWDEYGSLRNNRIDPFDLNNFETELPIVLIRNLHGSVYRGTFLKPNRDHWRSLEHHLNLTVKSWLTVGNETGYVLSPDCKRTGNENTMFVFAIAYCIFLLAKPLPKHMFNRINYIYIAFFY